MPSEETPEVPLDSQAKLRTAMDQVVTNYIQQNSTATFVTDVSWEVYRLVRDALRGELLGVQAWQLIRVAQHASPDRSIRYQGHIITADYLAKAEAGLLDRDPVQQPWVQVVTLHEAKRQTNSRDGNPRWMLTYSVGSTDDNLITVYTEPDAQFALNDLTALVGFRVQLSIVHNKAINVRPLASAGDPQLFGNVYDEQMLSYLQQTKLLSTKTPYPQQPHISHTSDSTGRFFTP